MEAFYKTPSHRHHNIFILKEAIDLNDYLKSHNLRQLSSAIKKEFDKKKHLYSINKFYDMEDLDKSIDDDAKINAIYKFYFNELPLLTKKIKEELAKDYIIAYQIFGDNLRNTGTAFGLNNTGPKLLSIVEKLNLLIKVARRYNEKNTKKDYFVIDALRNPYESFFFKKRYSAFYLISINAPDKDRRDRLYENKKMTHDEIKALEEREFPKKKDDYAVINIQKCMDIHIENKNTDDEDYKELNSILARYITLMLQPGLVTPTRIETVYAGRLYSQI